MVAYYYYYYHYRGLLPYIFTYYVINFKTNVIVYGPQKNCLCECEQHKYWLLQYGHFYSMFRKMLEKAGRTSMMNSNLNTVHHWHCFWIRISFSVFWHPALVSNISWFFWKTTTISTTGAHLESAPMDYKALYHGPHTAQLTRIPPTYIYTQKSNRK